MRDGDYYARAFSNRFTQKKVAGSIMLVWLIAKFEEYGKIQFNKGLKRGTVEGKSQEKAKQESTKGKYAGKVTYIYKGVSLATLCREFDVGRSTFNERVKRGWPLKAALTVPTDRQIRPEEMD